MRLPTESSMNIPLLPTDKGAAEWGSGMKKDDLDRRQALSDVVVRVRVTVSDIVRVRVTVMYAEAARLVEV